jgi:hypothetical protein
MEKKMLLKITDEEREQVLDIDAKIKSCSKTIEELTDIRADALKAQYKWWRAIEVKHSDEIMDACGNFKRLTYNPATSEVFIEE